MSVDKRHMKRLGLLLVSCLFIVSCGVLFASFGYRSDKKISLVEFEFKKSMNEVNLLDSSDIMETIETIYPKGIVGVEIKEALLDSLEASFRKNPFVKEVELYIDKKARLSIEIQERSPLLRVISLKGDNLYIDKEAKVMPLSNHYTARVLVVTGHLPKINAAEGIDSLALLQNIFKVAQAVDQDDFMRSFVSEINVNHQSNITLVPLVGDFVINVNDVRNITEKLENLKIFLRDGLSRVGWDKYSEISIDYNHQIVGKKH